MSRGVDHGGAGKKKYALISKILAPAWINSAAIFEWPFQQAAYGERKVDRLEEGKAEEEATMQRGTPIFRVVDFNATLREK